MDGERIVLILRAAASTLAPYYPKDPMPEKTLLEIERQKRFFSPGLFFILCSVFTLIAWSVADVSSTSENSARFERSANSILLGFKNRMSVYTNAVVYTRNLFALKPDLSKEEFQKFVRGMNLREEFPGIQNIGYVRHFGPRELPAILKKVPPEKADGLKKIAGRPFYDVVLYVESMVDTASTAEGLDLASNSERWTAMERAARTGLPVATDRVQRLSVPVSQDSEFYFMVFVPLYKNGLPTSTPEERMAALSGFVYGGFRAPVLFGTIAGDAKMSEGKLPIQVFDGPTTDPSRLMYSKGDMADAVQPFMKEIELNAADHQWRILLGATAEFSPAYSRFLPILILFMGFILSAAVALSARNARRYADKLHEDILIRRQTEAQLAEEKQIVELTSKIGTTLKAEQDLKSIVQMVTDVATNLSGAKFGAFFYNTYEKNGEILTLYSLSGADKSAFEKFGMPRNTAVFKPTFEGTAITRVDDITKDPRYGKSAPHHGMPKGHLPVRSYLSVPVVSKSGKVLGGLFFGHPEPGVFTQRAEAVVHSIAIQAATAMDNANLYRELSEARAAADSANRAKSLFLANVSHEIRTPLGIMLGFAELTLERKDDPQAVEDGTKKILRNGRELTRIIGDVLDLSKIEANTLLIENAAFALPEFFDELEAEWGPQFKAKHLGFEVRRAGALPAELRTDSTRLNQILVNLLSNALKFTERGAIRLSLAAEKRGANDWLLVEIEDSGLGISEENKAQLFKTFSQGDSSITRRFGGSGLGLALSRQLARALGGDLTLTKSQLGVGTTFALSIPVRRDDGATHTIDGRPAKVRDSLDNVRVLLVEDSVDNQILISTFLNKARAVVETANNGEEGVEKALSSDYSIVLMDIQMPVLDGYAAFQKLKAAGYKKPVIALTAHALVKEKEKAFELGFTDYLTKPVNRQALVTAIADAVQI